MSSLPNFFIIGAPKCGTTSLTAWLRGHLKIYMSPIKEPHFFSRDIGNQTIRTWDDYLKLFVGARSDHLAIGESTTDYLFSKVAVPTIEAEFSGTRYVVIVRNPVDMAYSLHDHRFHNFDEDQKDFIVAWRLSPERRAGKQVPPRCRDQLLLDYQAYCLLGTQLERLYKVVVRERVLVLLLDDVKENPRREYLKVLDFLGVPDDGRTEFPIHNPAKEWRNPLWGRALHRLGKRVARAKHVEGILPKRSLGILRALWNRAIRYRPRLPMPADVHRELLAFYEEDICKLEALLGRDLSHWRMGK
jgi:hypothetical protein